MKTPNEMPERTFDLLKQLDRLVQQKNEKNPPIVHGVVYSQNIQTSNGRLLWTSIPATDTENLATIQVIPIALDPFLVDPWSIRIDEAALLEGSPLGAKAVALVDQACSLAPEFLSGYFRVGQLTNDAIRELTGVHHNYVTHNSPIRSVVDEQSLSTAITRKSISNAMQNLKQRSLWAEISLQVAAASDLTGEHRFSFAGEKELVVDVSTTVDDRNSFVDCSWHWESEEWFPVVLHFGTLDESGGVKELQPLNLQSRQGERQPLDESFKEDQQLFVRAEQKVLRPVL